MSELNPQALDALKNHWEPLDEDGVMIAVSRQALSELIEAYESAKADSESGNREAANVAESEGLKPNAPLSSNQQPNDKSQDELTDIAFKALDPYFSHKGHLGAAAHEVIADLWPYLRATKRESVALDALKKIDAMLGNAIGAGAVRRGEMMSEADSRFFWIFDVTKEALSKIEDGETRE